jgi:2,5-furandicarboxylate decarboxylase 1
VKLVIVVDEDIDIYNAAEVEWAIATRFQADKDMVLESNCRASKAASQLHEVELVQNLVLTRPNPWMPSRNNF